MSHTSGDVGPSTTSVRETASEQVDLRAGRAKLERQHGELLDAGQAGGSEITQARTAVIGNLESTEGVLDGHGDGPPTP